MTFRSRLDSEKAIEAANRDSSWRQRLSGLGNRLSTRRLLVGGIILILLIALVYDTSTKRRTVGAFKKVAAMVQDDKPQEPSAPQPKLEHVVPPVAQLSPEQKLRAAIAKLDSLRTSGNADQRRYADSVIFANFGKTETVTVAAQVPPKNKPAQRKLAYDLKKVNISNLKPGIHNLGEGRVVVVPK